MGNMINCKACNKEIAKGVAKCPHCGKDQRNLFSRHKILTGIVVLIILAGIGSAAGNNKPVKVGEKTATGTTANSSSATDSKTQIFKVGDIVKLDDYKVTVNKVYDVPGNELSKPKEGNQYLAVDCTIENTTDKEQAVSSIMMFKVVDKDGRACEMSIMGQVAAKAGQLDGTIGAGRKMSGVYAVEVPKGTTGLQLEFSGSLLSSGQIIVQLN